MVPTGSTERVKTAYFIGTPQPRIVKKARQWLSDFILIFFSDGGTVRVSTFP
jgi:hypothetical protein